MRRQRQLTITPSSPSLPPSLPSPTAQTTRCFLREFINEFANPAEGGDTFEDVLNLCDEYTQYTDESECTMGALVCFTLAKI